MWVVAGMGMDKTKKIYYIFVCILSFEKKKEVT